MASFNIDGVSITGTNITIRNGTIIVDGKVIKDGASGVVEVKVTGGKISKLDTDASVSCLDVSGDVHAGGSVNCDNIGGNVNAGGSVNCDDVGGNINAGGSVRTG